MTRPRHERLATSPLIEAVLEIRTIVGGAPFSLLPGTMAERLRVPYPNVSETELARVAGMLDFPPEAGLAATHRYSSINLKRIVQLGPGGISLSIQDYADSFEFEDALRPVVKDYFEVARVTSITRLGLRYVNGIREPNALNVKLDVPTVPGSSPGHLLCRSQFKFAEPEGELGVVISTPEAFGTRLDLDFSLSGDRQISVDGVLGWFDSAHERIYEAFRALVRPEIFDQWREKVRANG